MMTLAVDVQVTLNEDGKPDGVGSGSLYTRTMHIAELGSLAMAHEDWQHLLLLQPMEFHHDGHNVLLSSHLLIFLSSHLLLIHDFRWSVYSCATLTNYDFFGRNLVLVKCSTIARNFNFSDAWGVGTTRSPHRFQVGPLAADKKAEARSASSRTHPPHPTFLRQHKNTKTTMNNADPGQQATGSPRAERLKQRTVAIDRYERVRLHHVGLPGQLLWIGNANWNDGCTKLWNNMLPPPGCPQLEARLCKPNHELVGLFLFSLSSFLHSVLFFPLLFFQVDCSAGCPAALHQARGKQRKQKLLEKCVKEMKHLENEQERDDQAKLKADAEDRAWANVDKYANPSLVQMHARSQALLLDEEGSCELKLKVRTMSSQHSLCLCEKGQVC
jgi:hypothetical protein